MSPIEKIIDGADWQLLPPPENPDGLPFATHEGVIDFAGIKLRVFQLNTGERIIEENDFAALFGVSAEELRATLGGET